MCLPRSISAPVLLHLMDDFEVARVSAQTFAKFGPRGLGEFEWGRSEIDPKKPFDVEDYSIALLKFKSGKTVTLEIADMQPTWCMEIRYSIQSPEGLNVQGVVHNTIHRLGGIP